MFEIVHTCPDWYDGPRGGIADYQGHPHLFEAESDLDIFLLSPLEEVTFRLALEDWEIWRRYETAFYQGRATQETHPALPEDRARHEELQRLLEERLTIDPTSAFRKVAEFRVRHDPSWSGLGFRPLEVQWDGLEL